MIDQLMIIQNSKPQLRIGSPYASKGTPRVDFKPDTADGAFRVEEGEELALSFEATLEYHQGNVFVVR